MVFEAVWSLGSYTKAARQLGITQPAVSQNIAELEKELGVVLFTRVAGNPTEDPVAVGAEAVAVGVLSDGSQAAFARGGKMLPTPAAEVFIKMARKALRDFEDIRILFNPEAASYGVVRLRADRSASEHVLPKVMNVLKSVYQNVDFEVLPSENESDDANVVISTVAIEQRDGVLLHFEVFGSATPFVEAVRLILSDF